METDSFGIDHKSKNSVIEKLDIKQRCRTTNGGLKNAGYRLFYQPKLTSTKRCNKSKTSQGIRGANCRVEFAIDFSLNDLPGSKD